MALTFFLLYDVNSSHIKVNTVVTRAGVVLSLYEDELVLPPVVLPPALAPPPPCHARGVDIRHAVLVSLPVMRQILLSTEFYKQS